MAEAKNVDLHLVFSSGQSWFAVPAMGTAEVVSFPELTRVPGAPSHLLGVFAHRGEVIPVVNLAALVGSRAEGTRRAVLLRLSRGVLALTATQVAGVATLSGKMEPLGNSGIQAFLRGPMQTSSGHREVALLDPEGLFGFLAKGN